VFLGIGHWSIPLTVLDEQYVITRVLAQKGAFGVEKDKYFSFHLLKSQKTLEIKVDIYRWNWSSLKNKNSKY
jgi:hypothetical protein